MASTTVELLFKTQIPSPTQILMNEGLQESALKMSIFSKFEGAVG